MSDNEQPTSSESPHPGQDFVGRWEVVSGKLGPETIPVPTAVLTLGTDRFTVESPQGRDRGRATWREVGGVVQVDLVGTGGAHSGLNIAAIARTRGPVLQLCYAVDGTARPTRFDAPVGVAWVTVRYRRLE